MSELVLIVLSAPNSHGIFRYALDISLPEHVIDSQTMKSLWNETNVIISMSVVAVQFAT